MFQATLCPSSGAHDYTVDYHQLNVVSTVWHKYIAGSDNTHHPFKIIPSKNYKINFDKFLTYITHNYIVPSIFVYSVKYKYKCTHTHFRSHVLYGFCV
jgi:hypothetical protein